MNDDPNRALGDILTDNDNKDNEFDDASDPDTTQSYSRTETHINSYQIYDLDASCTGQHQVINQ